MRRNGSALCLLAILAWAPLPATARDEPHEVVLRKPVPSGQAADLLRQAAAADDDERIRKLASTTWPDPFEVTARMLFPWTPDGQPTETDREALARFARAASDATGVRAFVEHWLAATPEDFARERELWRVTGRVNEQRVLGRLEAALSAADAALPLLDAVEHSHQGPAVRRLRALILRMLGRNLEAIADLEDVAARLQRRGWRAFEGRTRLDLIGAYVGAGRPEDEVLAECARTEPLLEGARDWKRLFGLLGHKAASQMRLGRLAEAQETVYRSMTVAKQSGRAADVLGSTLHLAGLAARTGRHETASALRQQVFERAREAGLIDTAAWAAHELVWSEVEAGRHAAAMLYGDWLEDHAERLADAQTQAGTHLALGDLAVLRGRYEAATRRYQRALEVQRGAGSAARVFTALSRILWVEARREALSPAGEEALAALPAAAETAAVNHDTLPVLTDWSARELALGRVPEADRIARRALRYARSHAGHPDAPLAPLQLARVALARGRWREALDLLEPLDAAMPRHHGWRIAYLENLARAHAGLRRWEPAVEVYRRAVTQLQTTRVGLAVREALSHRQSEYALAARGAQAAHGWYEAGGGPAALEAAWWFLEMTNSRLLASSVADKSPAERAEADGSGRLARALEDVEHAHDRVVRSVFDGDAASQVESRQALNQAYETLDRVEARAARQAGRVEDVPQPVPLTRLMATLNPDVALLAYVVGHAGVVGMAVTTDGVRVVRHGESAEARRLLSGWRRLAATPGGPEAKLATRLYDTFLRPFEDLVSTRSRWIVLPDGALSGVPLDAWIRTTDGTSKRVLESHTVTYAHGHAMLEALARRQATRGAGHGLVALGEPTHATADGTAPGDWQLVAALGRGVLRMPALPQSGVEARGIAALYPEAHRTLLLADDAGRAEWLRAIEGRDGPLDCVHLACHGLVDDGLPSLSGLVFAGGEMLTAERLQATRVPADLVVLSACQSGGETVAAGEGLMGLTRAFLRAGATRVLCTTWQVADASTADLMLRFHRARIEQGQDDAQALRTARLALMRTPATAHPYHWAGFQLWGAEDR